MIIIKGDKGSGKTTELIKKSSKEWKYIVCSDIQRVKNIKRVASFLGLDIPHPVTLRELPLRSRFIESVLIDDIESVVEYLIKKPVDFATTSCEVKDIGDEGV